MGCGPSKTQESAVSKNESAAAKELKPSASLPESEKPSSAAETEPATNSSQPGTVNVEFSEDGSNGTVKQPALESRYSRNHSLRSQESKQGLLGPTGVYVPSSGFKTSQLSKRMVEKYDMPEEEVQKAIDFAESEEFVDVYCFTYCITGGPMEPTAFKVAGLQGMDKEAILQWATAPGNEDLRVLTAEEQTRHKKVRDEFLVSQALQPEAEEAEEQPDDIEELTEAYRIRFEADTESMSLEEVMEYFGVPEISKVAIHKHLHPARGSATATMDEIARRKAAHPIALDRFDALS